MRVVLLFVAIAGCSHTWRRTTASTSAATVAATATREATATVATTSTAETKRTVQMRRTFTPRPDGSFDVDFYLGELITSNGQTAGASNKKEAEKVNVAVNKEAKGVETEKTGRPWWHWGWTVLIVVGLAMMWRLRPKLRRL